MKRTLTPDQALQELLEGNKRYIATDFLRPRQCLEQRESLIAQQEPFAVIVGCSDSRVPAELIFDQGLGDLFIVRVAGGVLGTVVIGSIEYAVQVLKVPLIVVLGHQSCGAVIAAVQAFATGNMELQSSIRLNSIMHKLEPSVVHAKKKKHEPSELVDAISHEHIARNVDSLKHSTPILAPALKSKKINIVGAYYELSTGHVRLV